MDLGSTNIKVVAVRTDGAVVARRSRRTPRFRDCPSASPAQLFDIIEDMLLEAVGESWAIDAVCSAGVGEDGLLLDPDGQADDEVLAWFDPRRVEVFAELTDDVRALAVKTVTGVELDPARTVVGWQWVARTARPDGAWVALTDYPAVRWTGRLFMSDTLAARTAAWSPLRRTWLGEVVDATLGTSRLRGPVLPAGTVVGRLNSVRLRSAGVLTDDALVVVGGHDHPIAASLAGRLHTRSVLDSMGTAEVVVGGTNDLAGSLVAAGPDMSVSPGLRGRAATVLAVAELARNVGWASESDATVGRALVRMVEGSLPLPRPDRLDGLFVLGAQGGHEPAWTPRGHQASAEDRAGAALLAAARHGHHLIDLVQPDTQATVHVTGGWTRSPGWMAIKASVSDHRIEVLPEPEVTGVGAALIAGDAIGWQQDPSIAAGYRGVSH